MFFFPPSVPAMYFDSSRMVWTYALVLSVAVRWFGVTVGPMEGFGRLLILCMFSKVQRENPTWGIADTHKHMEGQPTTWAANPRPSHVSSF